MKKITSSIFAMFFALCAFGQSEQYVSVTYSSSFFGTGDLSGSSLGANYTRMVYSRLGVHGGVLRSTGSGNSLPTDSRIFNVRREGSDTKSSIGNYNTFSIGLAYRATEGDRQSLFVKGGLSYNSIKYNTISEYGSARSPLASEGSLEVFSYYQFSATNFSYHIMIDYQVLIDENLFFGLYLATYPGLDIHSHAGLSFGVKL